MKASGFTLIRLRSGSWVGEKSQNNGHFLLRHSHSCFHCVVRVRVTFEVLRFPCLDKCVLLVVLLRFSTCNSGINLCSGSIIVVVVWKY